MAYQICRGSLIVVARNASGAIKVFDQMNHDDEPVTVRNMAGQPVAIEKVRAEAAADEKDSA